MRTGGVVFIGSGADARGFRLAGVDAVTRAGDATDGAVTGCLAAGARRPALVIVSAEANLAARDRLAALEADPDGPIVVVLPDQAGTPI